MTDNNSTDIVTKLNREADQAASLLSNPNNTGKRMALIDGSLLREAADEIERLRKERDEARQLYCGAVEKIQHGITNETKRSVADFLGWDCFKENTNG